MPSRILIVDDNREIVRATQVRLNAAGYQTFTAFDGIEGIATAVRELPDVILMDIRMPGKDGLTALCELKRRVDTQDIPVVMLSASVVDQKAALESGARYFLRKPHDAKQLFDALRAITVN